MIQKKWHQHSKKELKTDLEEVKATFVSRFSKKRLNRYGFEKSLCLQSQQNSISTSWNNKPNVSSIIKFNV